MISLYPSKQIDPLSKTLLSVLSTETRRAAGIRRGLAEGWGLLKQMWRCTLQSGDQHLWKDEHREMSNYQSLSLSQPIGRPAVGAAHQSVPHWLKVTSFCICISQLLDAGRCRRAWPRTKFSGLKETLKGLTAEHPQNLIQKKMTKMRRLTLLDIQIYYNTTVRKILRYWYKDGQIFQWNAKDSK